MLFDPVLNSVLNDDALMIQEGPFVKSLVCAHCYKPIKGKYFQSGENYYDEYCWQFKFVIDPLFIERASKKKIMHQDEDEY